MAERSALAQTQGLRYLRLPLDEGSAPDIDQLRLVTSWILERISGDGPVLIHCREGRGRSAMVACATLVRLGIPVFDAYQTLRRARPDVALNDAQEEALRLFARGPDVEPRQPQESR
jgi:protein-tyrosine phosphatase